MTITDRDIRNKVTLSLASEADDFDIDGIVREIIATYGLVDTESIEYDAYWGLIKRHARTP